MLIHIAIHFHGVYYHSGALVHHLAHLIAMHVHGRPTLRGVYYHS